MSKKQLVEKLQQAYISKDLEQLNSLMNEETIQKYPFDEKSLNAYFKLLEDPEVFDGRLWRILDIWYEGCK